MVNIERPDFDEPREQEGFRALRAGIARQAGAESARSSGGGLRVWFRREDEAEYYDGESAPG